MNEDDLNWKLSYLLEFLLELIMAAIRSSDPRRYNSKVIYTLNKMVISSYSPFDQIQ